MYYYSILKDNSKYIFLGYELIFHIACTVSFYIFTFFSHKKQLGYSL